MNFSRGTTANKLKTSESTGSLLTVLVISLILLSEKRTVAASVSVSGSAGALLFHESF